jgi:hypothetical protein
MNMWPDRNAPGMPPYWGFRDAMFFDRSVWNDVTQAMSQAGMNMLVIDLGDAVKYDTHPEIALSDAWTCDELRAELTRLRALGIEPIPKLNFSTGHDAWLKEYSRMVSTPQYYAVCADLISEVCALFGGPRFFHIGMDEETAENQTHFNLAVIRQHELYWHDFQFLVDEVEKHNARAWIWSDMVWDHPDAWLRHVSKRVLQSNWYYENDFSGQPNPVPHSNRYYNHAAQTYALLERHGYDQVPTASVWSMPGNIQATVQHCATTIAPERLFGFLMAPWFPTIEACRDKHMLAVRDVGEAIQQFESAAR